jgi:hypothetical protein
MMTTQRVEDASTFPMYPQKGTLRFPFIERTAVDEPRCGSFVVMVACNIVIYGRIRGREPFSEAISCLIFYNGGSAEVGNNENV